MACQGNDCKYYDKQTHRAFYDTYCRPEMHSPSEDVYLSYCLQHSICDYDDGDSICNGPTNPNTIRIFPQDTNDKLGR